MQRNQARSASEWRKIVLAYQASGETRKEFAPRHGVTTAALQYWIRKLRDEKESKANAKRGSLVRVAVAAVPCRVELDLGQGRALRFEAGTDIGYVTKLVDSIVAAGTC